MKNEPISVSKAKKAIADYKKAIGRPDGMAELSISYCEAAFGFLESCGLEDESCFAALIRMYGRSLEFVLSLPPSERANYLERLDKLRSRGRHVGWGVHDELNGLWYAATLDEHQGMTTRIEPVYTVLRLAPADSTPAIALSMICINAGLGVRISFGSMARDMFFIVVSLVWLVTLVAAALFVILA